MANLEVIALDTVTPQLKAPQLGDGYAMPRPVTITGVVGSKTLTVDGGAQTTGSNNALLASQTFSCPTIAITGGSGSGTTVTLTFAAITTALTVGDSIQVTGTSQTNYNSIQNGVFVITASTTTSVSFASTQTGTTTGGVIQVAPTIVKVGTTTQGTGSTTYAGSTRIFQVLENNSERFGVTAGITYVSGSFAWTQSGANQNTYITPFGQGLNYFFGNINNLSGSATFTMTSNGGTVISTNSVGTFGFGAGASGQQSSCDILLGRDAAGVLSIRNGVNNSLPTGLKIFNIYTANSEYAAVSWASNILTIGTAVTGTGTLRTVSLVGSGLNVITTSAKLTLGAADAAVAVAQTFGVQGVVAGTSNTAGANLTLAGSQGTGTGVGGSLLFQTAPAGGAGTAQNALVTQMTVAGSGGTTLTEVVGSTALTLTGATQTTAVPVLNATQTWNIPIIATTGASGTGTTATITFATQAVAPAVGSWITIAGVTPTGYNGTNIITASSTTSVSYANTTTGAQTVAGTVQYAPTAIKLDITDTASANSSYLLDLRVGGVSKYTVNKSGALFSASGISGAGISVYQNSSTITFGVSNDLILSRKAAASLQLGAADAAAPAPQTIGPQSVLAGTSNTAGSAFTIRGSQGTGTGVGGNILFQVAPAGTAGTAQNALATAMTVYNDKTVAVGAAFTVATLPAAGTQGRRAWVTDALAPTFLGALTGGGAVVTPVFDDGTAWVAG